MCYTPWQCFYSLARLSLIHPMFLFACRAPVWLPHAPGPVRQPPNRTAVRAGGAEPPRGLGRRAQPSRTPAGGGGAPRRRRRQGVPLQRRRRRCNHHNYLNRLNHHPAAVAAPGSAVLPGTGPGLSPPGPAALRFRRRVRHPCIWSTNKGTIINRGKSTNNYGCGMGRGRGRAKDASGRTTSRWDDRPTGRA